MRGTFGYKMRWFLPFVLLFLLDSANTDPDGVLQSSADRAATFLDLAGAGDWRWRPLETPAAIMGLTAARPAWRNDLQGRQVVEARRGLQLAFYEAMAR